MLGRCTASQIAAASLASFFAPSKDFSHRLKKHIHHSCVGPRQKQADIFAGCRTDGTIHIKVFVAGLRDDSRAYAFAAPVFSDYWLKPKPPFIKEKHRCL